MMLYFAPAWGKRLGCETFKLRFYFSIHTSLFCLIVAIIGMEAGFYSFVNHYLPVRSFFLRLLLLIPFIIKNWKLIDVDVD